MKKFFLSISTMIVIGFLCGNVFAYTTISSDDALAKYLNDDDLIVVDVREEVNEYCYGHIPCAINLPLNSGVFDQEYYILPKEAAIMVICRSGSRSARAASILGQNGYTEVYSVSGGMSMWAGDEVTCNDEEDCEQNLVYFPHIASGNGWETEIAIINTSTATSLSGVIKAYNSAGEQISEIKTVDLAPAGRIEMKVGDFFQDPHLIRYLIFTASTNATYGYLKFYNFPGSSYRVSIPASADVNQDDIIVSHIAMSDGWWTGLNLVNTTKENRTLTINFNNGQDKSLTIAANNHQAINLADFLDGWELDEINSATISNAHGIIGLEIFGRNKQLSGVRLRDTTTRTLYYPHIASDNIWWTGIVAFNTASTSGELVIKPYAANGTLLSPPTPATEVGIAMLNPPVAATPIEIGAKERYMGAISQLDLPEGTAWMAIESSVPVSGFELFGSTDNQQLAGYTSVGIDGYSGVFPKQEDFGWSGVALVNTTSEPISVTLQAYKDDGSPVASQTLELSGFEKVSGAPENIFTDAIDTATYIAYKATAPVVAFQLNGDGEMLDALPGR